ncbi:MAG: PAS domain-containing protein [Methylotenera sp.]|nr:PAS domain-containing protein [Oligoflexia bacterium]
MQLPTPTCVLIGSEHRFLMANPAYEKFFSRSVVGKRAREVFTPEELGHYLPLLDQVHETGTPYVGRELPVKRVDEFGKIHELWVDLGLYPYQDDDEQIQGVQVLIYDVTQQVTDRRRLHESEERFRQVSENLTDHVVHVMDLDPSQISYVSPSYERIWKRSIESVYSDPQSFLERVHPEDRDRLLEAMSFQNRGKSSQVEYRLLFEDGSIRWIQDNSFPVMNSEGRAFRATGIAQDITERKFSEARLKESGAKLLTITNAIPQMVWSTLPDGYHDFYNDRWYAFTGVPPGSTDGEGWNQMFHPNDRDRAWKAWRHSLSTGDPYEIEYRLRHHSGNHRWTLGRALPVREDSGQIIRWMGTCTDIQEIRETGEELTAAVQDLKVEREMREKFVAALTHDMRTPLTSAKLAGQLILKINGVPSAVKSLAEPIR